MGGRALRLTSTVAMLMSLSPQERCWLMFWRTNLLKYRCRWKNDATPIADTILTNADVQVILKVTPTLSQHMLLADLDVTSIAFDGRYVYGSQRSVRALSHRCIWHALIERLVNDQALQSFWKAFDPINERNRDVVYSLRHAFSSIAKSSDIGVQTYRECIWNFWKKWPVIVEAQLKPNWYRLLYSGVLVIASTALLERRCMWFLPCPAPRDAQWLDHGIAWPRKGQLAKHSWRSRSL